MSLDPTKLLDFSNLFEKESLAFRKKVIDSSLDEKLSTLTKDLKQELRTIFTKKSTEVIQESTKEAEEKRISSTDVEIVKSLTGVKNTSPSKSFSELDDGIIFSKSSKNSPTSARLDLNIDHDLIDDLELQYAKAREFFSTAVFAIPTAQGDYEYYKNNGYDPGEDLKIKCSSYTETEDEEPFGGMSPERRFNKDAETKGVSTWTLKQRFLEQIPNNPNFVKLNTIVDSVKRSDFNQAFTEASNITNKKFRQELENTLQNIEDGDYSGLGYRVHRIFKLINDIKVKKDIRNKSVIYKIETSNYSLSEEEDTDFFNEAKRQISFLKVQETQTLLAEIQRNIQKFINRLENDS